MAADYPAAYENQPGFDFLVMVPTWWDETKILQAEVGQLLVTARRKGKSWCLGGLSAHGPRDIRVPLTFLPRGDYAAKLWMDGPGADPNALTIETRSLTSRGSLPIHCGADGGFVAEIAPLGR
jgi:alpha-glucosidase